MTESNKQMATLNETILDKDIASKNKEIRDAKRNIHKLKKNGDDEDVEFEEEMLEELETEKKVLDGNKQRMLQRHAYQFAPPTPPTSNDANRGHSARGGNDNQDGAGDEYNIVNGFG